MMSNNCVYNDLKTKSLIRKKKISKKSYLVFIGNSDFTRHPVFYLELVGRQALRVGRQALRPTQTCRVRICVVMLRCES